MYFLAVCIVGFAYITTCTANELFDNIGHENLATNSMIQELVQRMDHMESREKGHIKALAELEIKHQLEIDGLKQELAKHKGQIVVLQKKSSGQARLISKLLRHVQLRSMSPGPGSRDSISVPSVPSGKDENKKQKIAVEYEVNRIRRVENEIMVAFTVGLTHHLFHAGPFQNIVFDHVETNIGNGYNSHHGVFTAPVSGLYLFYSSILSINDGEVWCQIVVNGNKKASIYARGTDGRHDQGSQAIIVYLHQGDDVAVQNIISDHVIYGDSQVYSTFSGVLLQQSFSQPGSILG
ncbi:uncharacterized protein LOC132730271 [Ruditapes philippinarum]|uniref:uncharacterized protein LOC132730271 n=1 Tax=Ruditapes philippinarum TaxID=129788 RepID=UPI00295ABA81|nr:uncharacterized protein LOC132730271 [Ruditapes philippinarum]